MRQRIFHFAALMASILLVLTANLSNAASATWIVVSQPTRLVNGSPVFFRVTTPKPVRSLAGTWLGHEVAFNFDASSKTWFALAGISQETKAGLYPLELHAEVSADQTAGKTIAFEKKIAVQR